MDADIGSVITQADLVVVGLHERKVFDGLRSHLRDDQAVLDLVSIPDRATLKGRYMGMCW
jgi:hypothetical protein